MTARAMVLAPAVRIAYPLGTCAQERRQLPHQNFSKDRLNCVTDADHRVVVGSSALAGAAGHFSAGDLGVHGNGPLSSMGQTYRGALEAMDKKACTKIQKRRRGLSDGAITERLVSVIGHKARKAIARAADACERTVYEWCQGKRLPSAGALIRLMAADDEVYQAVIDLVGKATADNLEPDERAELLRILDKLGVK